MIDVSKTNTTSSIISQVKIFEFAEDQNSCFDFAGIAKQRKSVVLKTSKTISFYICDFCLFAI